MNPRSLSGLVGCLREAARPGENQTLTDADLLHRWVQSRDEAAFELLVWRHGRLVLSVCRRLLSNPQDVEDAFQATFLVLVRKSGGIARRQALASWLHTVAHRIALQVRARPLPLNRADSARLALLADRADPSPPPDLRDVLDEEVGRLPEKYRVPFVLCYLQGRTNEEAARELGRPLGTILSRLSRARERLRQRLERRGLAPSSALLGPALAGTWASVVSADLVGSTTRAALAVVARAAAGPLSVSVIALVEGAIRDMFVTKIKTVAGVLATVVLLGVGSGVAGWSLSAQEGPNATPTRTATGERSDLKQEIETLKRELSLSQERTAAIQERLKRVIEQEAKAVAPKVTGVTLSRTTPAPSPSVSDARDQLELLQLKKAAREAELRAVQSMQEEAVRRLTAMTKAKGKVPGAVSVDDLATARITADRYQAEVKAKECELLEASLLLRQAVKRLEAMKESGAAKTNETLEKRLQELEAKVAVMQKALDQLGKGTRGGKVGH